MRLSNTLNITGQGDLEIVMERQFKAPATLVYDAYTKPELLRRWFGGPDGWSMTVCEVDLRVGGTYRFGMANAAGDTMGMSGIYKDLNRPDRMVNTERFDPPWGGSEQLITTDISEADGISTFRAVVLYETKEGRDGMLGAMTTGVAASYDRLEDLLAGLETEEAQ
jgi:uncharacterized protein YndB with AHSA1/START domain